MAAKEKLKVRSAKLQEEMRETGRVVLRSAALVRTAECVMRALLGALLAGASPKQAQRELEKDYHVSPQRARLAVDCARASVEVRQSLEPGEVSLYVGIPFCPTRCAYCSFVSADVGRTLRLVEPYLEGLLREVAETGRLLRELGLLLHGGRHPHHPAGGPAGPAAVPV